MKMESLFSKKLRYKIIVSSFVSKYTIITCLVSLISRDPVYA